MGTGFCPWAGAGSVRIGGAGGHQATPLLQLPAAGAWFPGNPPLSLEPEKNKKYMNEYAEELLLLSIVVILHATTFVSIGKN
jgi:hypothetical protein